MSFDPDPDFSGDGGSVGASGAASTAGKSNGAAGTEGRAGSAAAGTGANEGGAASGGSGASAGSAGADVGGTASEGGTAGSTSGGSAGESVAGTGGVSSGGGGGSTGGSSAGGGSAGSSGATGGGGTGASGGGGQGGGGGGSTGGPCTTGVFGAHTYAFCGVVANAAAAYARCASLGLGMVSIESKFENDYVQGKQDSTWLGGTDEGTEGEWRWVTTNTLFWNEKPVAGVYQDFIDGQPNNKDKDGNPENCLVLTKSGWNDVGCELGDFKATCESSGGPFGQP